ncbi:MAG TPA: CPBP family intramembrane glutamic endopeptidase [Sphingomicrobium sp.]|nr:CPBP family intramembrane glutamic endopeptidase [Sphingomicrobium sp.]
MDRSIFRDRTSIRALIAYLVIWAASTAYLAISGGDWVFPFASLIIFGLIFSGVIWFLTRKMNAPDVPVNRPARESIGLLAYLSIYAVLLIGIWLGTLREAIPEGPNQEWAVLGYKLLIHVGVPAAIILALGGAVRPLFDGGMDRKGFWTTLIVLSAMMFVLLALVSPSLTQIGALNLDPAWTLFWVIASWTWLSIEAGICEEFLFRACLQSRLTAWMRSPVAGIAVTSILFGLAHWPGLYFRGGPGVDGWSTDPIQVAAFTIATLSPLSVSLGLLWARSRSLLLIVIVHGAIDALPHTAEMAGIWG